MSDIVTLNGYKIKDEKAVRSYETVALMKADTKLKEGQHIKTRGSILLPCVLSGCSWRVIALLIS